jgi:hypothetical protein
MTNEASKQVYETTQDRAYSLFWNSVDNLPNLSASIIKSLKDLCAPGNDFDADSILTILSSEENCDQSQ